MKQRTSLYWEDEELAMIERAKEYYIASTGMTVSRNKYIRHLVYGLAKNYCRQMEVGTDKQVDNQ